MGSVPSSVRGFFWLIIFAGQLGAAARADEYTPRYRTFSDHTISWNQPDSSLFGYNGFCGHTAWANVAAMYTGKQYNPNHFFNFVYADDVTPGLRPDTLQRGLNALFSRAGVQWAVRYGREASAWSFLETALGGRLYGARQTPRPKGGIGTHPFLVLLQTGPLTYHWVTVVGLQSHSDPRLRQVIVNHMGLQEKLPLSSFLHRWGFKLSRDFATTLMKSQFIAGPYLALVPKFQEQK